MRGGFGASSTGHSNRVFSVKFVKEDENLVVSGGWDNTVQIWDTRIEHSVRSFYGPHVCGDSIDVINGQIVTGYVYRQTREICTNARAELLAPFLQRVG